MLAVNGVNFPQKSETNADFSTKQNQAKTFHSKNVGDKLSFGYGVNLNEDTLHLINRLNNEVLIPRFGDFQRAINEIIEFTKSVFPKYHIDYAPTEQFSRNVFARENFSKRIYPDTGLSAESRGKIIILKHLPLPVTPEYTFVEMDKGGGLLNEYLVKGCQINSKKYDDTPCFTDVENQRIQDYAEAFIEKYGTRYKK